MIVTVDSPVTNIAVTGESSAIAVEGDVIEVTVAQPGAIAVTVGEASQSVVVVGEQGPAGATGPQGPAGSDANVTASNIQSALGYTPFDSARVGAPNGAASLDGNGQVPSAQLPSFVDDVLEFASLPTFPATGETGKIYVARDTNKTYRWSGTMYVQITSGAVDSVNGKTGVVSLTTTDVPEGANLYHTAERAAAAAPVQSVAAGDGISVSPTTGNVVVSNSDRGSTAVATHESASDPHPQYLLQGEGDARYAMVAFTTVTGNTGAANADSLIDSIAITGQNGISTTATDTPDGLVIAPSYGTPVAIAVATTGAGTANTFARADHVHGVSTAVAVALAAAAAEGTATELARADHVHPFPSAANVNALADAGANGIVARTAANVATARTIQAGTGVSVTNGDGVAGNPTVSNAGVTQIIAGTGVTISPTGGTGAVTINASGGGGGGGGTSYSGDIAFITLGGY